MADAGTRGGGRGDLTQGNIGATLLSFALPTLASSIIQSLNGTINAIWVGRFLGEHALAATSNANMVTHFAVEEQPSDEECVEEAQATREPGGALSPAA